MLEWLYTRLLVAKYYFKFKLYKPRTLVIIRGLPSAGKTTLAKMLPLSYIDKDMFNESKAYDTETLAQVHRNYTQHLYKLFKANKNIVCAMVFPRWSNMKDIMKLAKHYNYRVVLIQLDAFHYDMDEAIEINQNKITANEYTNFEKAFIPLDVLISFYNLSTYKTKELQAYRIFRYGKRYHLSKENFS